MNIRKQPPIKDAAKDTAMPVNGAVVTVEDARAETEQVTVNDITGGKTPARTPNTSIADAAARNMLWLLPVCALGISFVLAHTHLHGPPCLMRELLHIPCPGCGMTRSFNALWHGDLTTSFRFHPLGLPLFSAFAVYGLCAALQKQVPPAGVLYARWTRAFNAPRVWKVVLGLMLGVWGARLGLMLAGNHYFIW